MDADEYTFHTVFREDDNEFAGYCAEFPELSAFALDEASAMRGIEELVADAVANMKAHGQETPKPFPFTFADADKISAKNTPEEKYRQEGREGEILDAEVIYSDRVKDI